MKRNLTVFSNWVVRVDRRYIQLIWLILALILFALAAGAPGGESGPGPL